MATISDKFLSELTFVESLFLIIFGWLLVELWQRVIDNFTFNAIKLNRESTYHTFIIALATSVLFLTFIFGFENFAADFVETGIETGGGIPPPTDVDNTTSGTPIEEPDNMVTRQYIRIF